MTFSSDILARYSSDHSVFATAPTETVSFTICAFPINYRQTVDISPTVFLLQMSSIVWAAIDSFRDWLESD